MVKRVSFVLIFFFQVGSFFAQSNKNIDSLSRLIFPQSYGELSDIWGYSNSFGEYALVGLNNGVAIVDITVPTNPVEVFYAPGANSVWRDLKVWNNHAYITNETANGLMIIDLSRLPGAILATDVTNFQGIIYPFQTAHDLYIDENGICYVMGADNGVGGAIMLDLNPNPKNPVELGRFDDFYLHDGMVRGDTLWGAAIFNGVFAAIDVSDKTNPVVMAMRETPNFTTHNCWISDDGNTIFTTDEVSGAYITAYDVSDLSNISEIDRIQSSPGERVVPHNTFFINDYLVTSYYKDGVTIHDVSNPNNMIEVGNFDTSPFLSGSGSGGCWGVYPYLPSGIIIASDIERGLFVLRPNYVRGATLKGKVTNAITSDPIDNVSIEIISSTLTANTNAIGNYIVGVADEGSYDIVYSKFGFLSDTVFDLMLIENATVVQNIQLDPRESFTLEGQVLEGGTSNPIQNATVQISTAQSTITYTATTDALGNFSISDIQEENYNIYIGKWGYNTICISDQALNAANSPYEYLTEKRIYDDFILDLGWSVTSSATTGIWERGEPIGTSFNGFLSNPNTDNLTDCGLNSYITGNNGTNAGSDDVDDGETVLTSPVFDLSNYSDPHLFFDRWFFVSGGEGTSNDSLVISLNNGNFSQVIDFADTMDVNLGSWVTKSFKLDTIMPLTDNMTLIVRVMDNSPGHIVEAGFDKFFIVEATAIGVSEVNNKSKIDIYPNPFSDEINVEVPDFKRVAFELIDLTGKTIDYQELDNVGLIRIKNNYQEGIYFMRIYGDGEFLETKKLIKL